MLHLVFKSLTDDVLLQRLAAGDDVVFLDNAVLALLARGRLAAALSRRLEDCRLFVLEEHLAARGLAADELASGIKPISYADWVALTVENKQIQSWT